MSENHESPLVFLQLVKEQRCPHCGGQARLLVDIDTGHPQLNVVGKTQYFCLQCEQLTQGQHIIQRKVSRQLQASLYRISTLGQFSLEQHSGSRVDLASQQTDSGSLLCCLMSSPGRGLGHEQAIEMLWPDLDFETATNRLDQAVYNLCRLFEPGRSQTTTSSVLLTEHASLMLADQSQVWVDADAFEALLSQARVSSDPRQTEQLLEEAMLLYGGDYLPQERAIPWVQARCGSLHRSWTGLLLELADLRIAREALSSAIDTLDRLLAADPANEAAVQRLITLLAQSGRRAEARRIYQRFAFVLRQEYKIAPLAETRALLR